MHVSYTFFPLCANVFHKILYNKCKSETCGMHDVNNKPICTKTINKYEKAVQKP